LKISKKLNVFTQPLIWVIKNFVLIFVLVFLFFMLSNSFPQSSYESVASKWSKYGRVIPPKDYEINQIRPIDYDFLAPKESAGGNDFYSAPESAAFDIACRASTNVFGFPRRWE
jgi:hypothetical protein